MKYYHLAYAAVMVLIILGFFINNRQNDAVTILLAFAALVSTSMYTFHHNRSKKNK